MSKAPRFQFPGRTLTPEIAAKPVPVPMGEHRCSVCGSREAHHGRGLPVSKAVWFCDDHVPDRPRMKAEAAV
jgi:hypothetical protein